VSAGRVVLEVADDHPEVVEIPVQRFDVFGGLQHHMAQPLHLGWHSRRTLHRVGAVHVVAEVEDVWTLACQLGQFVCARDHLDRNAAGVHQPNRNATDGFR
jgi:hypothetical protein